MARRKGQRRLVGPRWARACVAVGVVLMVLSGGALVGAKILVSRYESSVNQVNALGGAAAPQRKDNFGRAVITGPVNLLLVGIDPRPENPDTAPGADSIMILHIPKELDRGFLFSLPRDAAVDVPGHHRMKLTDSFRTGAQQGGGKPNRERGLSLLAATVKQLTGLSFHGAAIIDFAGFRQVVDAMGGVDMYVDTRTLSEHLTPQGVLRKYNGEDVPRSGPQRVYEVGQHHFAGWEALDYVRQRKGLPRGDYDRQRHQQQFIKAMVKRAKSGDVLTNPAKLDAVIRAAGASLTVDRGGIDLIDWAFSLRKVGTEALTMLKVEGATVYLGNAQAEQLNAAAEELFAAVRSEQVDQYVTRHPALVNRES